MLAVLIWAQLQCVSYTPLAWHNPIWRIAALALGRPIPGAISINPFVTETELMKLATYVAIGWLTYAVAQRYENAHSLFIAVFVVAVVYAAYGIVLSTLGTSQLTLLEGLPPPYGRDVNAGFVSKNSFATFTGLGLLAGLAMLVDSGRHGIVATRGWRTHLRTLVQFAFGRGAFRVAGMFTLVAALVASDSRAGLIATLLGLVSLFCLALAIAHRYGRVRWTLIGGTCAGTIIVGLFLINGHDLQSRFENLIDTAGAGELRPVMWGAAIRGLADHPLLGTGLGTYGDAYHLYANSFVPFVVDRAHNDYLEFALGLGLPASGLWILALLTLVVQCAWAALTRRRRQIFSMTAVGASVLIAFHSIFDFSLQMPAVAVLYAIIMGLGVGQLRSSHETP
jgi:O-antigen ligase